MSEGHTESHFEGLSSLIRFTGAQVPARARFVAETVLGCSLSALTFGLVCGQVGSATPSVGPLVPYLCGSWFGFTFGLLAQWRFAKRRALHYCRLYPALMTSTLHHEWDVQVPEKFEGKDGLEEWVVAGNVGLLTTTILAAQSCITEVDEIQQKTRQRFVDEYTGTNDD
jgi:hypothetical protein